MKGYWYFFQYQWKEKNYTYILQYQNHKNRMLYSENLGGNHPPSVDVLQKMAQEDEG